MTKEDMNEFCQQLGWIHSRTWDVAWNFYSFLLDRQNRGFHNKIELGSVRRLIGFKSANNKRLKDIIEVFIKAEIIDENWKIIK